MNFRQMLFETALSRKAPCGGGFKSGFCSAYVHPSLPSSSAAVSARRPSVRPPLDGFGSASLRRPVENRRENRRRSQTERPMEESQMD